MARWDDGYVTDVAYTANFYREITPPWLAFASLLLGHRPPDLTAPFRYADFGCGNGLTAIGIAATFPQADVWGFDFNPAHIEFARWLAGRAGLDNVRFVEASFGDLAAMDESMLPSFDFIVSHGVLSWVSPENRRHLMAVIGRQLKPGGLVYLSYNVITGWAAMVPLRALMRMLAEASPERTDQSVTGVLDFLDRLKQGDALYFRANQVVDQRLQDIRRQDLRYVAHEYLNQDWNPLMFADVAGAMAEAKCRYIGSATLAENIDTVSVPAGIAPILAETRDPILREALRDIGSAQTFRRDLYRKGVAPMPAPEQQALLDELSLVSMGAPVPEGDITFTTPVGNVTGRPEIYRPLLSMLETAPLTLRSVSAVSEFAQRTLVEVMQAFTLLVSGGYAHPLLPASVTTAAMPTTRALNLAIARANANAADLPRLIAPAIGTAVGGDVLETLIIGELLEGQPEDLELLTTRMLEVLGRSGRHVHQEGTPVTDPQEARRIVGDGIRALFERRLPYLRRVGVL